MMREMLAYHLEEDSSNDSRSKESPGEDDGRSCVGLLVFRTSLVGWRLIIDGRNGSRLDGVVSSLALVGDEVRLLPSHLRNLSLEISSLELVHVGRGPPRTSSPPRGTDPARIGLEALEGSSDDGFARGVVGTGKLSEISIAVVGSQPVFEIFEDAFSRPGSGAFGIRSARIAVKVLMDFKDDIVEGIRDTERKITIRDDRTIRRDPSSVRNPRVSTSVAIAGHEDGVLRTGLTQSIDGQLNGSEPRDGRHAVRLIHQAVDDEIRAVGKLGVELKPKIDEMISSDARARSTNDLAVIATIVVRINDYSSSFLDSVLNDGVVKIEVLGIQGTVQSSLHTVPQEGDAEVTEAKTPIVIYLKSGWVPIG